MPPTSQGSGVAGGVGPPALTVADDLEECRLGGDDDGQAHRHRLEGAHRGDEPGYAVVATRDDEQVERGRRRELGVGRPSGEDHAVLRA